MAFSKALLELQYRISGDHVISFSSSGGNEHWFVQAIQGFIIHGVIPVIYEKGACNQQQE